MQSTEEVERQLKDAYIFSKKKGCEEVLMSYKFKGYPGLIKAKINDVTKTMDVLKIWLLSGKVLWENGIWYGGK